MNSRIRNTLIYLGILTISFFVGIFVFDRFAMPLIVRHGQSKPIPDLTNMPFELAKSEAKRLGFRLDVYHEEPSVDFPVDFVISQIPKPGSMAKSGRTIRVVRSLGNERVAVPDVVGKPIREARLILQAAKLTVGEIEEIFSDSVDPEVLISTNPTVGESLLVGTKVDVVVSLGKQEQLITVPDFSGMEVEDIENMKGQLELGIVYVYRNIPSIRANTVYQQSIEPGKQVYRGNVIRLLVSKPDEN